MKHIDFFQNINLLLNLVPKFYFKKSYSVLISEFSIASLPWARLLCVSARLDLCSSACSWTQAVHPLSGRRSTQQTVVACEHLRGLATDCPLLDESCASSLAARARSRTFAAVPANELVITSLVVGFDRWRAPEHYRNSGRWSRLYYQWFAIHGSLIGMWLWCWDSADWVAGLSSLIHISCSRHSCSAFECLPVYY